MITKKLAKETWDLMTNVSYGMSQKTRDESFAIIDEYFKQPVMGADDGMKALDTIEGLYYQEYAGDPFPFKLKEELKEEIQVLRNIMESVQSLQDFHKKVEEKLKEVVRPHTDIETGEKYYQFHVDATKLYKELLNENIFKAK